MRTSASTNRTPKEPQNGDTQDNDVRQENREEDRREEKDRSREEEGSREEGYTREEGPAKKAPAKKAPATNALEPVTIALAEGVELAMFPIPDTNYLMGRFPVTQARWKAVMGKNPSQFKGADRPVESVSWKDCQKFVKKLNACPVAKASGLTFRLPTEKEWEYACRAGSTGDYCKLPDGTEITEETLGEVAWFDDNSGDETHPVGQKKPNAFGLYDMHGNVLEWTNTAFGESCVFRGGSWFGSARLCESSFRNWLSPSNRDDNLGFRLCASGRAD